MSDTRSLARGLLVVMVIGLVAGYALGAQQSMNENQRSVESSQRMSQMPGQTGLALTLVRTDKLIGKDLKDTQGQTVGKAEDIVLNPSLRQVSYIALNSDGKYYAVPWSALRQAPGDMYTLSITRQDLSTAQAFEKDRWPAEANPQLMSRIQGAMTSPPQGIGSTQQGTAYPREGTAPSQQGTGSSQQGAEASRQGMAQGQPSSLHSSSVEQRRVTKLDGTKVKDNEGSDIGDIKGFVIDLGGASSGQMSSQTQTSGSMGAAGSQQAGSSTGTTYGQSRQSSTGQLGMGRQMQIGHVVFTILSVSGGKYSLVPSNLVNIQPAQHTATANAAKQTVDSLAFSRDSFPNLSNRQYVQQVYETFGQQPYWSVLGYVPAEEPSQSGQMNRQGRTGETGQTGQTGTSQTDQSRTGDENTSNE